MAFTRFYCAVCGSALSAPDKSERHLIECSQCRHVVPAPAFHDSPSSAEDGLRVFPHGVLALELKFLCTSCDRKLQIDARWEGRTVDCPECSQSVSVPFWSRRARPAVALTADEMDFLTEPAGAGHT